MINTLHHTLTGNDEIPETPVIQATDRALKDYGLLIDDYHDFNFLTVRGAHLMTNFNVYNFWWKGNAFYSENEANGHQELLGWSVDPKQAEDSPIDRDRILFSGAICHAKAGVLFYPLRGEDYIVILGPSGDHLTPKMMTAFYIQGGKGLFIKPGVWHNGVVPLTERASFYYEQAQRANRITTSFSSLSDKFISVPISKIKQQYKM